MRDRFKWEETDNTALAEIVTIGDETFSCIIRDYGHRQTLSVSAITDDKVISMWADDLYALNRKIPFFSQALRKGGIA